MTEALEIVDLAATGQVQLRLNSGQDLLAAPPVPFSYPLEESDHQEIAWYFTRFLQDPFGDSRARAQAVETGLANLGRRLFGTVFQGNQEAQGYYTAACAEGLSNYRLVVVSTRPEFLGLPWELLYEPGVGFLAPRLASLTRRASSSDEGRFSSELSTQQFNVLQVSPLPVAGPGPDPRHAPPGSLAGEVVQVLESLDVVVELDCLRPPTIDALAEHLSRRPGHYHTVHLDALAYSGSDVLVFEGADGGPEQVAASRVADLLVRARVPMVLLNGCGVGPSRPTAFSNPAAVVLAEAGVPVVVSVPFPLARPARTLLAQHLYQSMVKGGDVATALSRARQALMDNPQRASLAGRAVFWDWITPQVYQSQVYLHPAIEVEKPDPLTPPVQPQQAAPVQQLPQGGPYGLVGRRAELRQLERLLQQERAVLLAGRPGVGKSELALGLARWLQKTGARPGGVFYTTFQGGAGLERVVHEIGTAVAGLPFANMSGEQRRQWVVDYLQQAPSLVVWDGLQTVAGGPGTGGPGLLDPEEQKDLDGFLSDVVHKGDTWVLLTSRREEEAWLTVSHRGYRLSGLGPQDRLELASQVQEQTGLAGTLSGGQADSQLGPAYLELLDLLEGHPLALRIALPLLKEVPASVVLGELRGRLEPPTSSSAAPERDPFLAALMDYSFSRMPRRSRVHLPFMAMFQQRVMLDILTHITQEAPYRRVMGEELGWGACRTLLRSARDAGFLESVTPSVYQIHPSIPWFYGQQLSRRLPPPAIRQLEQEFVRVYADTADYFMETLYENQDSGTTAVLAEEGNLTQALGLALEDHRWDTAQLLVQPLAQVYRMQKRFPELRRLRRQLLQAVDPEGGGAAEAEAKGAVELWLYLLGTEASEAVELLDLERSQALNQQLLDYLTSLPGAASDPRAAAVYHQMGVIEQHRWHLTEAEDWFQRSLAIIEKSEDRAAVAEDYYCLGQVSQTQRRYAEAKEWFGKALEVHQRLQDEEEMVKDYRALGLAAQHRFEYEEAESWYRRAQAILEANRDEETAVLVYHELGTVYHARYLFDEAEELYRQALGLSDRLGLEAQMAVEFHYLGLLAQARGLFYDDAENWYELALQKREKLGDRRGAGDECRHLGVLFHEQKRLDEAEAWYQRALEAFEEVRDVDRTARTYGQLGRVVEERGDLAGALEWAARAHRLAAEHGLAALGQAKAHLLALREKYGEENFTSWWRGFTGGEPPTDLNADTDVIP